LVEYLNFTSDGFKNLPNNANTGFDKNDVVLKFRVNSNLKPKFNQAVEFKFQYSDEDANETYLGLTDSDFENKPFDRYAASQKDNIKSEHIQFTATHILDISKDFRITTTGYYNDFSRNWYKLNDVVVNDTKVGINSILTNPTIFSDYLVVINGSVNYRKSASRHKDGVVDWVWICARKWSIGGDFCRKGAVVVLKSPTVYTSPDQQATRL